MKVVICGSFWRGSLEQSYREAFESIGCVVIPFDWDAHEPGRGAIGSILGRVAARRIGSQLVDLIAAEQPGLTFIVKGRHIPPETVSALKRVVSSPVVNFNPDSAWDRANGTPQLRESIELYDAHFTWNRSLVQRFRLAGAKEVFYLPFAYDPMLHQPLARTPEKPEFDAVFIGTYDIHRDKLLAKLDGCTVAIWGNEWKRAKYVPQEWIQGEAIYGADAVRCVNRGNAAINILRPQNAGSHNMRTFEIPATRNVLLTDRTAEQESFLREGAEMLCYESIEELRAHLVALREDAVRAQTIRDAAYERIKGETYAKRAAEILRALDLAV